MVHEIVPEDPGDLAAEVLRFLEWMRDRGYSERTVYGREGQLGDFVAWCRERGIERPQELTRTVLELYQKRLAQRRKPDGSRVSLEAQAGVLTTIRTFCRYLVRQRLVLYNPAAELEMPRTGTRIPRAVLTAAEAEQVMVVPDVATPVGLKDRAILETLYSTGVRRAELARLEISDVDFDRGALLVREGKHRRDRVIPIGERALRWIWKYLEDGRPSLIVPPDDGVLFLTRYGRPYRPDGVSGLVTKIIKASGIGKRGSAHLFRHTMATAMLEGGADIRFIQQMLGHSSLKTTQVYTQVSVKALKEVHDATHPAARLDTRCRRERPVTQLDELQVEEAAKERKPPASGPRILLEEDQSLLAALAAEDLGDGDPN